MNATCNLCGNTSSFDKGSLKESTITINGIKVIMCCGCEDEMLEKLAKRRSIGIKIGEGGEISKLDVGAYCGTRELKLANGYRIEAD